MLKLFYLIGCATFCITTTAEVAPTPGTQDTLSVFNNSDLVCSCYVQSVTNISVTSDTGLTKHIVATLEAQKIYKSDIGDIKTFQAEFDDTDLSKGSKAVIFLKAARPSAYMLADRFIGVTPFTTFTFSSERSLQSDLISMAQGPNRNDQLNAMRLLQGFSDIPAEKIDHLVPLCSSPDTEVALAAHAVLLKHGGASDVGRFRNFLQNYSSESPPPSILSIGSELGTISDRDAIPFLEDLSNSKLLSIRIGAMQALRKVKSPSAAASLVKRLDDTDQYVRYLAVITLAETFENYGDFAPNMDLFDHNPGFYVGLWKSWWVENGNNYRAGARSR